MRFISSNILLYFFLLTLGISGFFFAVIWPHAVGFYTFIVFAATGGFGVALYVWNIKRKHKELVCPVGSDCNVVITSRYAKFLGIPLEYCGMTYYAIILISYITLIFAPQIFSEFFLSGLVILTTAALLFSLYLLFIQAFILKQWCIWCLLSAMLSIGIFIVSLGSIDFARLFLTEIGTILFAIHNLGFILGMGGVTITFFLFIKFLSDFHIDNNESQILKGISELVWLGLGFVLISQFASYIAHTEILVSSGEFLIQTIALFITAISEAVLMIIFAPFLIAIPFQEGEKSHHRSSLESLRKFLFITGGINLSSWSFAFVMDYLQEYKLPVLLVAYVVVLIITIIIALLLEKSISKSKV